MKRFDSRWGAAALVGVAVLYMILSFALGRPARAERPPELRADEAGLDVWKAAALLVREQGKVAVIDVRPKDRFELYHLPSAVNLPGASASEVRQAAAGKGFVLIVADADKDATALAAELAAATPQPKAHFLKDGVRNWYLAFDLPVPLFTDKAPPHGYAEAMAVARPCLSGACADTAKAIEAIGTLSKSAFEPTLLQGRKPAAAAGGAKKKISGGCGG